MQGKLIVVSGAQFGSEGKGAIADQLTRASMAGDNVVAVRVAGPNAGHTVYGICPSDCVSDAEHMFHGEWIGHPWKLRTVPVSAVCNREADLVIAAGSEIDRSVLLDEVAALDLAGYNVSGRLRIDSQATVLEPRHIRAEVVDGIQKRLGSTAKGIGAARADRLWRYATLWGDDMNSVENTADFIRTCLSQGATVVIEGTQGYGLGLHAGNYPQCTSSDCRAIDFLAMTGISPWEHVVGQFEVWLAARVRPIRVAGNSGPLKGETTWADLGLPEERTTVTKKVRRVGEWDAELVRRAVIENGGTPVVKVAITMADTLFPVLAGKSGNFADLTDIEPADLKEIEDWLAQREEEFRADIQFIGTSPSTGLWLWR
jgi:adenylosuccinate synthase